MFRTDVRSRWFALADFVLVSVAISLWVFFPDLGWIPLIIALLPWSARLIAGLFPFRRTRFDLLLIILLFTAVIGVWAAYNRQTAFSKFWLLIGAVLLYYSLAGQPPENLWIITGIFALLGLGVALFFLFTHDWISYYIKIRLISDIGSAWQRLRPQFLISGIHPNDAAGIIAMMAPFGAAIGVRAWREKRLALLVVTLAAGCIIFFAFMLTSSRGAWFALAAAIGLWSFWILSKEIQHRMKLKAEAIFAFGVILGILFGVTLLTQYSGNLLDFSRAIPGFDSAANRQELAQQTIELIYDFPFTGGGLGGFPGLYSQYILVTPVYFLPDGHNLFLDIALEGGILASIVILIIYAGSCWILFPREGGENLSPIHNDLLRWGILLSIVVVLVHGMVDDWIFSDRGLPLLFALTGLSIAVSNFSKQVVNKPSHPRTSLALTKGRGLLLVILGMIAVAGIYINYTQLLSAWYANLGAVRMSRLELSNFPSNEWDDGSHVNALYPAEELFNKALRYNPNNRTANHRLGLIAMLRRDYPAAIRYLEKAYRSNTFHRGIRKNLGYSYLWTGQMRESANLLAEIPEALNELSVYNWWWSTQGRQDLAGFAKNLKADLQASASD